VFSAAAPGPIIAGNIKAGRPPEPRADDEIEATKPNGGDHPDAAPAQAEQVNGPAPRPANGPGLGAKEPSNRETKKASRPRSAPPTDTFDDVGRVIDLFSDAMREAGFHPPRKIIADGHIHRFSTNGEKRDTAGYYVLHEQELVF
jgi:hypothetical protein